MKKILALLGTLVLLASLLPLSAASATPVQQDALAKIEPLVLQQINQDGKSDFFVVMTAKADLSPASRLQTKEAKGQFVFQALQATAKRTQAALRLFLDEQGVKYQSYYIANKILVRGGDQALLMDIASRPDVAAITANHTFQLQNPVEMKPAPDHTDAVEPNIAFVKADQVWAMGITGQGTVVAGNDTGLDETHPAVASHYRGCLNPPTCSNWDHNYNWWDATGTYPDDPYDGFGHGTHTTGTMVGDDGTGNQIGMAPGAQTIHCKNMTDGGSGDDNTFITCFQWDLAPWDLSGANPRPDLSPDSVNNSWGYWGGNYPAFEDEIAALQAAGIAVEVSAGNEGASCGTLRSPGDYLQVLTTGSVDHGGAFPGTITDFSSRGPSALYPNDYFPDIMAPGNGIRSCVPGGGYEVWSGTSMAGPHATAMIGLLWSANPALRGMVDITYDIIHQTAEPLTGQPGSNCGGDYDVGPNNDWGYGTIDVLAAVQAAMTFGGSGTLNGTVTDASSGDPISGATIRATLTPTMTWSMLTNDQGLYSMRLISGTYTVDASRYGYMPATIPGVQVISGTTTTQDIALTPAEAYLVEGVVTDANTGWALYASIDIDGFPYGPIWTNPVTGYYSVTLVGGTVYTFHVNAWVPGYLEGTRDVGPLTGPQVEDFALDIDQDSCSAPGYGVDCFYYENFENDDGGFTVQGTTSWAWGTPTSGPGEAHSGYNVWATNPAGDYNNSEDGYITSPVIDLSSLAGSAVYFSWWQWAETESNYDYISIEVSNDGGASWNLVYGPLSGPIDMEWARYGVILDTSYAVADFQARFHFTSDGSVVYAGWYVDDICIVPIDPPTVLYSENFDADDGGYVVNGTTSWEWGAPSSGPGSAHSAPNVWATNLAGTYNDDENGSIESPDIDLSSGTGSFILQWWQWLETEESFDYAYVDVSNDGGATWANVYEATGSIDLNWTQHTIILPPEYAVNNFRVRFTLITDVSVTYEGWYVDDVTISAMTGVAIPCISYPGGLVVGNVYDANMGFALTGATVTSDSGARAVAMATPDPNVDDAFYTLFDSPGAHTLTGAMTGGYLPQDESVTIVDGTTIGQDFYLQAGILSFEPATIHVTLDMGASTVVPSVLNNDGGGVASFELIEVNRGFRPMIMRIPPSDGNFEHTPASIGPAPRVNAPASPTGPNPLSGILGAQAYAVDIYPGYVLGTFDSDTPGTWTTIGPIAGSYFGGDFLNGDFSTMYVVDYDTNSLYTLDTATAAATLIGPAVPGGGESWTGLTGAPDGTLYGSATTCGSSTLYTVDPATGATTPVGPITNAPCIIDIAVNAAGEMYGVEIVNDVLVQIDPATGAGTVIGSIGFNANYAQGMDFEEESGVLYLAAYDGGSGQGQLRIADTSTGNSVLVGPFPGGDEVDCLAFATGGASGVPWLDEAPITGTVPGGGNVPVDVTFDAGVPEVNQPGDYMATIKVDNDTPYGTQNVYVTMTVLPNPDMGKVEGTVVDNCDGAPVEATVTFPAGVPITQTEADDNGHYIAWLTQGTYDVVFSASGYVDYATTVDVTAGQTTTLDVNLVPNHACIAVYPDSFEIWVLTGTQETRFQTLINNGGQPLTYEYAEKEGGYSPPLSIPPSDVTVQHTPASIGPAPRVNAPASPTGPNPLSGILGAQAYAVDVYPGLILGTFDSDIPGTWTTIGPVTGSYFGGDFINGDFSTMYVVDYDTNSLYTLDTATAAATLIGPAVPGGGESWTGLAGAPDGTLYGSATTCGSSTLYTVDPATGATTPVGPITNGACIIDIAVNGAGEMYGVDIVSDVLVQIDPATGAGTVIGSIGFDANYAQGMDFEEESGVLYLAAFNNGTFQGELRIADTSTGNSVLVGPFPGGDEVDCLAFATGGTPIDVPWLWETPVTGTVAPLSTFDEEIGVTSWYVSGTQTIHLPLGTYTATLRVKTNATSPLVPVTMHIVDEFITPTASFVSDSPVCLGTEMVFTDTTSGGVPPADSWLWSFGDGATSTLQNPTHLYAAAGSYDVSLLACNSEAQCDTATATVEVLPLPAAGFTYAAVLGTVTFTNTSTDAIAYMWDFGDGITDTVTNPVHTYAASGSYTVTLWAMNGCGVDSYAAVVTVNVCEGPGGVGFAYSPAAPYVGDTVFFTGTVVTGTAPFSFTWDFGDSGTGSGMNASHAFAAAGTYTVTLTVANACGTISVLQVVTVQVRMYTGYLPIVYKNAAP